MVLEVSGRAGLLAGIILPFFKSAWIAAIAVRGIPSFPFHLGIVVAVVV